MRSHVRGELCVAVDEYLSVRQRPVWMDIRKVTDVLADGHIRNESGGAEVDE